MKTLNLKKNRGVKIAFYSALFFSIWNFISCESDSENGNTNLPDAEPIVLELNEKPDTDNAFALKLFQTTYDLSEEPNVFLSPLSMSMALGMTLNGAKGNTLEEMKDALEATDYTMEEINEYSKSLREALVAVDPSTTLSIANSIWLHNDLNVEDAFITVNQQHYDAAIETLDFNDPSSLERINNWVSDKTNNKIPKIIDELSEEAKICLVNAIYFKGVWRSDFDKNDTKKEDFYTEENVSMGKVDMMRQTSHYGYSDDENCRYLEMAYGNWAYNMIVMLPNEGKTLNDVIMNLDSETWDNAMIMNAYEVNLQLPRFSAECEHEMHESVLPEMGMKLPFSNDADFSGITGDKSLKISRVIHKTYIDVNEEGSEAAASTGVVGGTGSPPPGTVIDYVVNRPFAFAIRENSTGVILFIGKIGEVN